MIEFEPHPEQEPGDMRSNALWWIAENPDAMQILESLAKQALNRGRHIGMKMLCERLRWEFAIQRGDYAFKVNNSHVSYIARELVRRHPELAEIFSFRRTKFERLAL